MKNKKPPKFLYRYFTKDEYTERIFSYNELWFSNPNKFNDPFDCKALLTFERDYNQKEYINFVLNNAKDNLDRDLIYDEINALLDNKLLTKGSYRNTEQK